MRNTSRLLFALLLVSCVCIALLQPVEKAASREIPVHSTRSAAEEEILIRKMDVSRLIHDRFGCAEDGSWIYPADYAGLFDDGTMLVLSIKKGASKEEYQSILQEYGDIFKIQEVEYSWNELHQQAVKAANIMIQRNIHVSSYCVDAESNKIVFTAPEEDVENVFRVLEEEELTELSEVDLQDPGELNLTLRGGDYVSCDQAGNTTLGCCGIRMSQDSLLLCGHACNSQYDQIKKAGTNTVLGTVSVRVYPALNGTTSGDYSIVTVSGSHNLQGSVWNGWDSEGIRQIYGYNTYLYNNLDVISCGMTSDWKSGQIKDTNATSIYFFSGGSITITGMIKVLPNGSGSEQGDSGGPYFLEINNQLYFIGIHSGRIGAYQYFTPYSIIQNATGFYPYTYGN